MAFKDASLVTNSNILIMFMLTITRTKAGIPAHWISVLWAFYLKDPRILK